MLEARLVTCGDDPRHAHAQPNGTCPWCRIENDGGPSFFFLPPGAAPDAFDLTAAWRSIEAVQSPGLAALPEAPLSQHTSIEGLATAALRALRDMLGEVALRSSSRLRRELEREKQEIDACESDLRRLESQWAELCGERRFMAKRLELEAAAHGASPASRRSKTASGRRSRASTARRSCARSCRASRWSSPASRAWGRPSSAASPRVASRRPPTSRPKPSWRSAASTSSSSRRSCSSRASRRAPSASTR